MRSPERRKAIKQQIISDRHKWGLDYICWRLRGLPSELFDEGKENINDLSSVIQGDISDPKEIKEIKKKGKDWVYKVIIHELLRD